MRAEVLSLLALDATSATVRQLRRAVQLHDGEASPAEAASALASWCGFLAVAAAHGPCERGPEAAPASTAGASTPGPARLAAALRLASAALVPATDAEVDPGVLAAAILAADCDPRAASCLFTAAGVAPGAAAGLCAAQGRLGAAASLIRPLQLLVADTLDREAAPYDSALLAWLGVRQDWAAEGAEGAGLRAGLHVAEQVLACPEGSAQEGLAEYAARLRAALGPPAEPSRAGASRPSFVDAQIAAAAAHEASATAPVAAVSKSPVVPGRVTRRSSGHDGWW